MFPVVKFRVTKNLPCPVCGKRIKRSATFTATVNPFNVDGFGVPKRHDVVYGELRRKGQKWQIEPETHEACKEAQS
jgi:hypothetical protein